MRHERRLATMALRNSLAAGIVALGLEADTGLLDRLEAYLTLLERWNATYNLTAVRDTKRMVSNHLLDSLAVAPYLKGEEILDVGTGAGLPGIPLALLWPRRQFTLLDSSHKKTAFLRFAVSQLGMQNVHVVCERVERWRPARLFDLIISRAFAELATFVERTRHLLAPHGRLAAMKGVRPDDELSRLPADVRGEQVIELQVPGLDARRHLVLMECA